MFLSESKYKHLVSRKPALLSKITYLIIPVSRLIVQLMDNIVDPQAIDIFIEIL